MAAVTITDADAVKGLQFQVNSLTQQVTGLAAENFALQRTLNEIEEKKVRAKPTPAKQE